MPAIDVALFREANGRAPVREWLAELRRDDRTAYSRCKARIERLAKMGHELRRPEADYLQDGIHELRARKGHVNYRILYVFHGRGLAVLMHALTKEAEVPAPDIQRALDRRQLLIADPMTHLLEDWS